MEAIAYLGNPNEKPEPKLSGKYKLHEFKLINNLLYKNAELENKDVSRKEVKQLVIL